MTTVEKIFREAAALPPEDLKRLIEMLSGIESGGGKDVPTGENEEPLKPLAALAAEQGVGPFDFAETRRAANFWPEDESIDDFVTTVRQWRGEDIERELE